MPDNDDDETTVDREDLATVIDVPALSPPPGVESAAETVSTATSVEALPVGARQIDVNASIDPETAAAARQVRDEALASVLSSTNVEALPAGARQIDVTASLDRESAAAAQLVRDAALAKIRDRIDINATIVSKREALPAEQVRDFALDKVRAGEADDLKETIARPRRTVAGVGVPDISVGVAGRAAGDPSVAGRAPSHASDRPSDVHGAANRPSDAYRAANRPSDMLAAVNRPSDMLTAVNRPGDAVNRPGDGAHADRPSAALDLAMTVSQPSATPQAGRLGSPHGIDEGIPPNDEGPALDELDLALVARLRALPAEGDEPDWRVLEASIRDQVRDRPTYVPWWQSWRYLVPIGALAATAMITFVVVKIATREPARTSLLKAPRDAGVSEAIEIANPLRERGSTLWLDGEPFELGEIPPEALDEVSFGEDGDDSADPDVDLDDAGDGILPITDYGWIDALDDGEVERAETWLARKRS